MRNPPSMAGACVFRLVDTDWGAFTLVFAGAKLLATFLPQGERLARRMIASRFPSAVENSGFASRLAEQVETYFRGTCVSLQADIDWNGMTGFRRKVLEACRRIPFGATASYADLARAAGSPGAARAVGSAMASNPLPLIVPCHRVLRSDGSLGGFSSPQGPSQKERLLRLENPQLALPCKMSLAARRRKAFSKHVSATISLPA